MMVFKVNGVDFSGFLAKYGYETGRTPVVARSFQDLAGNTWEVIPRWRSTLTVTLRPLTRDQTELLSTELLRRTISVTYYNVQQGREVTEKMKCVSIQSSLALVNGSGDWWDGGTLKFEQR